MWLQAIGFISFVLFDVPYFLRLIVVGLVCHIRRIFVKKSLFDESSHPGEFCTLCLV